MAKHLPGGNNIYHYKNTGYNINLVVTTSTTNNATKGNNICQSITKLPNIIKSVHKIAGHTNTMTPPSVGND